MTIYLVTKAARKYLWQIVKEREFPPKSIQGRFWWTKWINLLTSFKRPLKRSHCFLNGFPKDQSPFLFLIFENVCSKVKIDGNLRKLWCGFGSKLSNLFCQFQHKVKTNQTQSSIWRKYHYHKHLETLETSELIK